MKQISTSCSKCIDGVESVTRMVDEESITEEITCRTCGGSRLRSTLFLSDDLIDLLNDMNNKIDDIFEKLNE